MGAVFEEFERQLAGWRRRYSGRPQQEMILLCLVALEREEIVSVAYREALIERRLKSMPITAELRELVRHAVLWAWKDEEMHAIYIRGLILKLGSFPLRAQAFGRQLAGAIAGWASSVRQHLGWSQAPVSWALAALITGAGSVLGQVPLDVRRHLRYLPFRDFCLFNVDAEKTAWSCWKRMEELALDRPDIPPPLLEDLRRVQADEERHGRVFEIFAAAFDDQDRLVPGETPDILARKIGAVGEFFLPYARRGVAAAARHLGGGGQVRVLQGETTAEKQSLFRRLLEESGLGERLEERARAAGKPIAHLRVAIKAAFMMGYHRRDRSPITDPVLLEELARYLQAQGCREIVVVEARNLYDLFYRNRTVHSVAQYFGIVSPWFRVVDLSEEQVPHAYFRGMGQYTVGRTWKEAELRISFGKMRSHPTDLVDLTIGNLEGMGARCDEFLFAERQAQRVTAILTLMGEFPPHFALLDAYDSAADGLVGVMGSARPRTPRRLYAGSDPVAVDMVAARHMGMGDPRKSSLLRAACHWFGDPTGSTEVVGTDAPIAGWRGPYYNEWTTLLSLLAQPVYEFGSGRGALFVPEMDEEAFPPTRRASPLVRIGRRSLQALLGLRHGR
jgi:uncharacterized protein (DUF362 family)